MILAIAKSTWKARCETSIPLRTWNSNDPRIIEAYCSRCGSLIGASPKVKIIAMVEPLHVCSLLKNG